MAVRAATMAGDPNPWVIRLKWVKCLWIFWSKIMAGFVLHRGDRSWFRRSINSFVINLEQIKIFDDNFLSSGKLVLEGIQR